METKKNPAAVKLGRLGGTKNTEAQQEARRRNGKLGGRPKKETKPSTHDDGTMTGVKQQQKDT